jgi:uncharacterized protein (TIGR02266 family)
MTIPSQCRTFHRHAYVAPVRFVVDGDEMPYSGYLRDIALGGAFVHSLNCPPDGASLRLRFAVPFQDQPVEVKAQVVRNHPVGDSTRIREVGFGVRFVPIRSHVTAALPAADDRRTAARRVYEATLRFNVDEPRFFTGFTRDLSAGGIFVQTVSLPQVGADVTVRFPVPGGANDVEAVARVVWTRPEAPGLELDDVGFGARFGDLPIDVLQAINRYVFANDAEFYV